MKKLLIMGLLLSILLLTACSSTQVVDDNDLILMGQVIIPGINDIQEAISPEIVTDTSHYVTINTVPELAPLSKPGEYIIQFTEGVTTDYINQEILKGHGKVQKEIADQRTFKIKIDQPEKINIVNSLASNPKISYIEPDYLIHIQGFTTPNDPGYAKQWSLQMLGLENTWTQFKGSNNIVIAVVDTGILPDHPDLKDKLVPGYDLVDNDNDPTDTDPDFSHGTHVAGIIGAMADNGEGIAGINWQVKIMPIRVIGPGGTGGYSNLISGIREAVDRGADIINLSLAGPVDSESLHEAVQFAVSKGVTVVAAAGNNGSDTVLYPARYPEVISVGAVGPNKERAYYSNYGPALDLVAPGGNSTDISSQNNLILSTAGYLDTTGPVYKYTYAQGTSMAAPHVSGLIGLLYSAGITDPSQVQNLLKETADDLGAPGVDDEYGAGLININRALGIDNSSPDTKKPDYTNLLSQVKITAARLENGIEVGKNSGHADYRGRFSLKLTEGSWTVTGWLDMNHNNQIDSGDYYGQREDIKVNKTKNKQLTNLKLAIVE